MLFGEAGAESFRVVVTQTEATEDMCTILRCVDAAPEIDTLTDATVIPAWSGRVGAEIAENLIQPSAPRFAEVATTVVSGVPRVDYLLAPGSGAISTAEFQVGHRLEGASSWTTISIPVANGGGRISGYSMGQVIQLRACGVSATGVAGPHGPTISYQLGSAGAGIPGALDADSISVTALLGGARIEFATAADPNLARVQLYRSQSATLDRETDATGAPLSVSSARSWSMSVGDTTRQNLLKSGSWTAGAGWSISGGTGTHAAGSAGELSQPIPTQTGRWYRIGLSLAGRTAGSVTPQLTGGSTVAGTAISSNGSHLAALQAVSGNTQFELAASSTFNGSVSAMAAYLQTPACLLQGTHYLWLEPQSADGVPGPVSGPFSIEVI